MFFWYIIAAAAFVVGWLSAIIPSKRVSMLVRVIMSLSLFSLAFAAGAYGFITMHAWFNYEHSVLSQVPSVGAVIGVVGLFLSLMIQVVWTGPMATQSSDESDDKPVEAEPSQKTMVGTH